MDSISPPGYLSLDLEVGKDDRILALAAVRADTGRSLVHSGGGLFAALARLDDFAEGASVVLGHNLIAFDLPHLAAAKPDLRLLKLPAVDTLRLSPLAFPRNPYHSLVKHYQDGGLKRGRVNDPSERSAAGCWTRRTACRAGATTSGPTTAMWGGSSASKQVTDRYLRSCA